MKSYGQRINTIVGQLGGINKMIEADKGCFEVLDQLKAARAALNSLAEAYLNENFQKSLATAKNKQDQELACRKYFKEIVK